MPIAVGTSLLIIIVANIRRRGRLAPARIAYQLGSCGVHPDRNRHGPRRGAPGARLDTDRLQRWFAVLVFAVAAFVVVDTLWLR